GRRDSGRLEPCRLSAIERLATGENLSNSRRPCAHKRERMCPSYSAKRTQLPRRDSSMGCSPDYNDFGGIHRFDISMVLCGDTPAGREADDFCERKKLAN